MLQHSEEQQSAIRNFFETVEKQRVNVELPDIAVCGATSSGKSSLLSAITGVILPADAEICTRCPTRIKMYHKNSDADTCSVRIKWSEYETAFNNKNPIIGSFEKSTPCELKDLTDKIRELQAAILKHDEVGSGVSHSVIDIAISGPNRLNLTITDLPGIVKTTGKNDSEELIEQIDSLLEDYLKNPLCIVLAVHPADVDFHNSDIFERVKEFDPKLIRSFPIVTKADKIDIGEEKGTIRLIEGKETDFSLGFHLVKLRSQQEIQEDIPTEKVIAGEMNWFRNSLFANRLEEAAFGVVHLRKRLAKLYIEHLCNNFDTVIAQIKFRQKQCEEKLKSLGPDVSSDENCRGIFEDIKTRIFDNLNTLASPTVSKPSTWTEFTTMRAVVEKLKQDFIRDIVPKDFKELCVGSKVNLVVQGEVLRCEVISAWNPNDKVDEDGERVFSCHLVPRVGGGTLSDWSATARSALLVQNTSTGFAASNNNTSAVARAALLVQNTSSGFTANNNTGGGGGGWGGGSGQVLSNSKEQEKVFTDTDVVTHPLQKYPMIARHAEGGYVDWYIKSNSNSKFYHKLKAFSKKDLHICADDIETQIKNGRRCPMAIFEGEPVFNDHVSRWIRGDVHKACEKLLSNVRSMIVTDSSNFASSECNPELQHHPRLGFAVKDAVEKSVEIWEERLREEIDDYLETEEDPETQNHYFTTNILKLRNRQLEELILSQKYTLSEKQVIDVSAVENIFKSINSKDIIKFVAEDTYFNLSAYYKVARKNIVDNVSKLLNRTLEKSKSSSQRQRRNSVNLSEIVREQFLSIDCIPLLRDAEIESKRKRLVGELENLIVTLQEFSALKHILLR